MLSILQNFVLNQEVEDDKIPTKKWEVLTWTFAFWKRNIAILNTEPQAEQTFIHFKKLRVVLNGVLHSQLCSAFTNIWHFFSFLLLLSIYIYTYIYVYLYFYSWLFFILHSHTFDKVFFSLLIADYGRLDTRWWRWKVNHLQCSD